MSDGDIHPGRTALRESAELHAEFGLFGDGLPTRLHAALGGELALMAEHIENGGELTEPERKWLASYLRTGRTGRRKLHQRIKEMKVVGLVESYRRTGLSEPKAIEKALEDVPESWGITSEETIRTYLGKSRNNR